MHRVLLVAVPLLALAACGSTSSDPSASGGTAGAGGSGGTAGVGGSGGTAGVGGSGGTSGLTAKQCVVTERMTMVAADDDAVTGRLAPGSDGTLGLTWWHDGATRDLRLSLPPFDAPMFAGFIPLTTSPLLSGHGLVAFDSGHVVAYRDTNDGTVHVVRVIAGAIASDTAVATAAGIDVGLGVSSGGRLIVLYRNDTEALVAQSSPDGLKFGAPALVDGGAIFSHFSTQPVPGGLAVAYVRTTSSPSHSDLRFALVSDDGEVTMPGTALTQHDKYVYDVSLVAGEGLLGMATTDSRADILSVPLYFTTISQDGQSPTEGTRLTFSGHHELLDMTYTGAAFALAYDEHDGVGSQVWVMQVNKNGDKLFDPLQVSQATYLRYGCCTDTRYARIASTGDGRALVVWSEVEAAPSGDAFQLKAAMLDCAD